MAKRLNLDDEDFLTIVREERRQSIGFESNQTLIDERELALNYAKGVMPDMPHLTNRSGAVSTDIQDAVETVMPDLMEIFTGGDDVATFKATSEKDEEAAKQETEFVNQVVFQENDGFLVLYSMFKDALQVKTGVCKFSWVKHPIEPERFEGKTLMELTLLQQDGKVGEFGIDGTDEETGEDTYYIVLTDEEPGGTVKIDPVPPEDFTVAPDTVRLPDTTYCAFRSRPRRQDLIAMGLAADVVEELPPYGSNTDNTIQLAREEAGEHDQWQYVTGSHNLAQVEVIEHYIRVDAEGSGRPQLWRVLTGANDTVLLDKEQVDRLPFAAITPYIITHRFYGESVADRLAQIQRLKTALIRAKMDSIYFALNQRHELDMSGTTEWTIGDLLRNEPGLPVRVKRAGTVVPIANPGIGDDVLEALEFVSVMGEQRTGIVRNAQGLNPDSLHDTAGGMTQLMQAAQMRMRLIARVFAETGLKDLWLGVHALLRKHKHRADSRLGGKWTPVDCSQWAERTQMTISLGLGSAGRAQELMAMGQILSIQKDLVTMQGGANGPVVTLPNIYAAVTRLAEKAGEMAPEAFFTDPAQAPPQQPQQPPGAAEAAMKAQVEQAKLAQQDKEHQDRIALDYASEHDKDQREAMKLQQEHERELEKIASNERIKSAELAVKRQDVLNRLQLEEAKIAAQIQIAMITAKRAEDSDLIRAQAEEARADVDIELQAREHDHENDLAQFAAENEPEDAGDDD